MINLPVIQALNKSGNFLIINNNSNKNIFLFGTCRLSGFVNYLKYVGSEYNIYIMYVIPYIFKEIVLNKSTMQNLLNNVDVILCETLLNYPGFNTSPNSSDTFFEQFVIPSKTTIVHIPNLEMRCYAYSNIHVFKSDQSELKKISTDSKNFLLDRLKKSSYYKTARFIDRNFKDICMFHTHNHPTTALLTMFFIETFMKLFGLSVTRELLYLCVSYDTLAGNNTPIFQIDIDNHNFSFVKKVYNSEDILKEGIYVSHDIINIDINYIVNAIMEEIEYANS